MGALPPVFIKFLGNSTGFMATSRGVRTELGRVEAQGGGNMRKLGGVAKAALLGIGVAAAVAAVKTTHMAADFQTQMTRVRTGAGESAKNMGLVGNGVLAMAGKVGESTKDLTAGLYMVESAGFHGQKALDVLRVSAQGAKVGAADLATVTDAVTTAMNAYSLGSKDAAINSQHTTDVMNALVGTEAEGKTNLEALAGSMSGILPVSAAAHVGLNEVLGAMATMTSQGSDARVAATYLRQTIGQLSNPSSKAAATMKGLGLSSLKVSKQLGKEGLAATLTTLTDAIKKKMGPGGTVLIDSLQKAAKKGKDFQSALEKMTPTQKTYIGALSQMVGGTKSMMGALMLTGPHMDTFKKNVDGIGKHVRDGGKDIEGWSDVQGTFNQKMAEFKGSAEGIGIAIGQKLLPYATKFLGWLSKALEFMRSHSIYLKSFALALGLVTIGLAAASIASWSFTDSLLANPITWIVAGIVALVAGLVMLILHWKEVWGWIKKNIPAVANAFKSAWKGATKAFHVMWDAAMKGVHATVKWFDKNVLTWVRGRLKDLTTWWKGHSKELAAVWKVLWAVTKDQAKIAFAVLKAMWTSTKTFFITGWHLLLNVFKVGWALISGEFTTGMHFILNLVAVILDLVTGHWSKAWADAKKLVKQGMHDIWSEIKNVGSAFGDLLVQAGKDLIHGFIDGVKSMKDIAVATVKGLGSDAVDSIKSILDINSPSKVFRDKIGKAIPTGLALGVTQNAHHVTAAMHSTADGMVGSFKTRLGINSPSKVFRSLGIYVHEGLIEGLTGSLSKVKAAIKKTETLLMQAMNRIHDLHAAKGRKGSGMRKWIASHEKAVKSLEKYVAKEGKLLHGLAVTRAAFASKIKAAQDKLKGLQDAWKSLRDDIASGIMQGASVVMGAQEDGAGITTGDVLANMQDQLAAAKQFASEISALKAKGLRGDLLEQIASAGVEGGGATAQALLGANAGQIKQLNDMQQQLKGTASATGSLVADGMYRNGINAAKGLIKGLQSQEKAIDKQMLKIAKSMTHAIKKALGIKSPSRVFHEIGQWVSAGLVNGVDSGNRDVHAAAGRMSGALISGGMPTLSGAGNSGHTMVQHVHVEVHGSIRSDKDFVEMIEREMFRQGARNSTTWRPYKR
jgi:TP901 family phage tail tape measure protein